MLEVVDQYKVPIYEHTPNIDSDVITHDTDVQTTSNSFVVSGSIYCEDASTKVEAGYVLIDFDGNSFSEFVASDETGNFTFFYEDCNNQDVTIRGYDPVENRLADMSVLINIRPDLNFRIGGQLRQDLNNRFVSSENISEK